MLQDIIEQMEKRDDVFKFQEQEKNVEDYLFNELKCKHVPQEIIEFYNKHDGCSFSINAIFSLDKIKEKFNHFNVLLLAMKFESKNRYIPFMNDGMGGYYAFNSDIDDERIYYFDHEFPDEVLEYLSFSELLEEKYKFEISE